MNPEFEVPATSGSAGVAEESIGAILQRGGGEIPLTKARDRFTLQLRDPQSRVPEEISVLSAEKIPQTELFAVRVAPENLETAMTTARRLDSVRFASHVYRMADSAETFVYLTDELTLQFADGVEPDAIASSPWHLQQQQAIAGVEKAFIYRLTPQTRENPLKIANRLSGQPGILTAEANIIVRRESFYRPKDDLYPEQWYLQHQGGNQLAVNSHIEVEKAWELTRGERSVVVAIADDGIELNHPDFQGKGKIVAPHDFRDEDFLPLPESGKDNHGTACAGVAVAEENGKGMVGVAPGCALMPLRTTGFLDDRAIEVLCNWAIEKGASVLSCSWGAATVKFPLSLRQRAAFHRVATEGRDGKGCVVLFAAGNSNRPVNGTIFERNWPQNVLQGPTQWLSGFAAHPDIIAVAASTSLGQKAAYSNWGAEIALCAPSNNAPPGIWFEQTGYIYTAPPLAGNLRGRGILSSDRLGRAGYDTSNFTRDFGGTSSACPVVAGVAALVLSANPQLTALEVKQILQESADKIVDPRPDPQLGMQLGTYDRAGRSQWFGAGRVNAYKAVKLARARLKKGASVSPTVRESNGDSVAIPDGDARGAVSRIRVREGGEVGEIRVSVAIDHEFLGDLEIYLQPPGGSAILLQGRTLGARTKLRATYTLVSTPALQQAVGRAIAGTWQLQAIDRAVGDTGTLLSWELEL